MSSRASTRTSCGTGPPSPRSPAASLPGPCACPSSRLRVAGRHYRGPGFRVLTNWCRLVDLGASETGNLVTEVLDESERALRWFAHRVGAVPHHPPQPGTMPDPDADPVDPEPDAI